MKSINMDAFSNAMFFIFCNLLSLSSFALAWQDESDFVLRVYIATLERSYYFAPVSDAGLSFDSPGDIGFAKAELLSDLSSIRAFTRHGSSSPDEINDALRENKSSFRCVVNSDAFDDAYVVHDIERSLLAKCMKFLTMDCGLHACPGTLEPNDTCSLICRDCVIPCATDSQFSVATCGTALAMHAAIIPNVHPVVNGCCVFASCCVESCLVAELIRKVSFQKFPTAESKKKCVIATIDGCPDCCSQEIAMVLSMVLDHQIHRFRAYDVASWCHPKLRYGIADIQCMQIAHHRWREIVIME